MNILYIADPNSIHDIKWMRFFSEKNTCFLIARDAHLKTLKSKEEFKKSYNIEIIGGTADFSTIRIFRTLQTLLKLRKTIKKHQIDVLHIMYADPNALLVLATWGLKNVKRILTTRGTDVLVTIPRFFQQSGLLNKLVAKEYRIAFNQFDHITSTSNKQITSIEKHVQLRSTQTHLIRTGIDLNLANLPAESRLPQAIQKPFIFFPRNMRPLYFHEFSIDAINLLPTNIREKYQFVFINKNSSETSYVQDIARRMEESDASFVFLDSIPQQELFILYSKADLVVMNSKSDGAPVSALEAMLCRTNVILPPLDYDKDLFEYVTKFDSWKPGALAKTIEEQLSINTINEENYDTVVKNADRNKEMSKLELLYLENS